MSKPKLKPGAVLFTEGSVAYEFVTEVGGGNHGERVLLARRRGAHGPEGDVYLKCIHLSEPLSADSQRGRARLEEEAALAMHLHHPQIAPVHGLKRVGDTLYAISEGVEGNALKTLLDVVPDQLMRYSDAFILYVGAQVARALAYAHSRTDAQGRPLGIVHRAVDSERIWITWSGQVKLTDFGLALSQLSGRIASTVRRPQGDVYSSSPEALLGLPVDGRADLFQLGLVLCELASGAHPLDPPQGLPAHVERRLSAEEKARVRAAIQRAKEAGLDPTVEELIIRAATYTPEEVVELTERLSEPLRQPVRKLLERDAANRYQTAEEVEWVLRASLDRLGAYGPADAAEELSQRLGEAGARLMVAEGGKAPMRARHRSRDEQTTR